MITIISLVFIILSLICFVAGFIFRIFRRQMTARLLITIASALLCIYSGLALHYIFGGAITLHEVCEILFFIATLVLFVYNLVVLIKKY